MNKHKISKYYLIISLITLISVMVFIIQQSYANLLRDTQKISEDVTVKPLDPNINIEVIDLIEKKINYQPLIETVNLQPTQLPQATPTSTPASNEAVSEPDPQFSVL